ncbi:hypothetical protein ACFX15_031326 [Malus domestica]
MAWTPCLVKSFSRESLGAMRIVGYTRVGPPLMEPSGYRNWGRLILRFLHVTLWECMLLAIWEILWTSDCS